MAANASALNYISDTKKSFDLLSPTRVKMITKLGETIINTLLNDQNVNLINTREEVLLAPRTPKPSKNNSISTLAPGDVLNGDVLFTKQPKKDPYVLGLINEMESRNTGYLSMAFEAMCEILSFKKPEYVKSIVKHTNTVIDETSFTMSRFQWLAEPMSTILREVALVVSEEPIDEMQTRAIILKSLMRDRRSLVGADVNEAFDLADNLISKEEGEHLFGVILQLKKFPNITKTGKELCKEIIQAFEDPFFHQRGTVHLKRMVKKANQAFIVRFPRYSHINNVGRHPALTSKDTSFVNTNRSHSHRKKPHKHKHSQKKPKKSTVKTSNRHTQDNTEHTQKMNTRRRKIKFIRPDVLLG